VTSRSLLTRAAHWFVEHDLPLEAEQHAYEAGNLDLAGALSCRRFVRESLGGLWPQPSETTLTASESAEVPELALIAAVHAVVARDRSGALMCAAGLTRCNRRRREGRVAGCRPDAARRALRSRVRTDTRALDACNTLLAFDLGSDTEMLHAVARLREAELLLDAEARAKRAPSARCSTAAGEPVASRRVGSSTSAT